MQDSFNFGAPAGRGPRLNLDRRVLLAAGGLAVAAAVVVGVLNLVSAGGRQAAVAGASVVQPVNAAQDVQAQETARNALEAAQTAYAESNTLSSAGPGQLSVIEPAYTWVDGPSTGPSVVSVATTGAAWAAAVRSSSGRCFWIRYEPAKGAAYGSGSACTGQAALAGATGASW